MATTMAKPTSVPGRKGLPFFGSVFDFARDPLNYLAQTAHQYGDIAATRFLGETAYQLNNPEYVEYILVTNHKNFLKDPLFRSPAFQLLFGNGLLTADGDFWLRQRRLAQPAFHRERIARYGEVMVSYTERMLDSWRDGEARNAHQDMMKLTLEVVAKTLFDADVTKEAKDVGAALGTVMDLFASNRTFIQRLIPLSVPLPSNLRFKRAVARLDEVVYRVIAQRRREGVDKGDLLSMLLAAQDVDGSQMTDKQLRDEVMTLFLAGHETTALTLSWTWYLLGQNPDVEAKLVAELQAVLAGRAPTIADLPRLHYTEKVITESMRLYPPAWGFGRQAIHDFELGGYTIPAGATIYVTQWVMHRDARYYSEPERFNPDRWSEEMKKTLPKYAYFPFSGGPRQCIGNQFAMMEATLMLATIAQRFSLELASHQPVVAEPSITLRPKNGLKVTLHQRKHEA